MDTKLIVNNEDLPAGTVSGADLAPHAFVILQPQNNREIMRLDKDGMIFLGQRITDAGEAYAAWMKTMAMMQEKEMLTYAEIIEERDSNYVTNKAHAAIRKARGEE